MNNKEASANPIRKRWLAVVIINLIYSIVWMGFGPVDFPEGVEMAGRISSILFAFLQLALVYVYGYRRGGTRALRIIQIFTAVTLLLAPLQWLSWSDRSLFLFALVGWLLSALFVLCSQQLIAINRLAVGEKASG